MPAPATSGWFGHPRGLSTLFFTEMWERFSYYGMRAFLILYMVHALGFDDKHAGSIYGTYTASACGRGDRRRHHRRPVAGAVPQRPHRRDHHRPRALHAGLPPPAVLLCRPHAHRHRHWSAQAQRQRDRRLALRAGRRAAGRRVLDLLHGYQPRRLHRADHRGMAGPEGGLAPGLRLRRRRHDVGPGAVRARAAPSPARDRAPGPSAEARGGERPGRHFSGRRAAGCAGVHRHGVEAHRRHGGVLRVRRDLLGRLRAGGLER